MGQPAAKQGDKITAKDTHSIISTALGTPAVETCPFSGILQDGLSGNVMIMGCPAATVGSVAVNTPRHKSKAGKFANTIKKPPSPAEPTNKGHVSRGSNTVMINGKAAARNGDSAYTCNDPVDLEVGTVSASGSVMIG